ncbi:MAG: AraC family transcriptional regulator [Lachnospiraceae bacterium]
MYQELFSILHSDNYLFGNEDVAVQKVVLSEPCFLHAHDFIEIAYVTQGHGMHQVLESTYSVSRGDVCILNQYVYHTFVPQKNQEMHIINCLFRPEFLDQILAAQPDFVNAVYQYILQEQSEKLPCQYFHTSAENLHEIDRLFDELYLEFHAKSIGYLNMMKADIIKLLLLLMRNEKQKEGPEYYEGRFNEIMVKTALAYLQMNYRYKVQIEELAEQFYVSSSHFGKIFRTYTGMTTVQMLQKIRMEEACHQLVNTNIPMNAVAESVGYSDMKYFYQLFKRMFGVLPGEYRKRERDTLIKK